MKIPKSNINTDNMNRVSDSNIKMFIKELERSSKSVDRIIVETEKLKQFIITRNREKIIDDIINGCE